MHAHYEQALKGPKRHQAVSGYWHSTTTLADYCRIRSYLVSASGHGIRATDAIHAALAGGACDGGRGAISTASRTRLTTQPSMLASTRRPAIV